LVRFVGLFLLLGVLAHSYDVSGSMSNVGNERKVNQRRPCKCSSLFTLAGALEVAYNKFAGGRRQFSVQEMVDCFHESCSHPKVNDVVNWLVLNDRLAQVNKYFEYAGVAHTCRAGTSSDGLDRIRVTGNEAVSADGFEGAIQHAGAVMACVDTSSEKCPGLDNNYSGGVLEGSDGEHTYYCRKNVLIVGYDDDSYKVRSSDGADWGENGYFRIARGGNACGIEQFMSVLSVERRMSRKAGVHPKTGCPAAFPRYCPSTKTCRTSSQRCVEADAQHKVESDSGNLPDGYRPSATRKSKRHAEHTCEDDPTFPCYSATSLHCKNSMVRARCRDTCQLCHSDGTPKCPDQEDSPGDCLRYARYCNNVPAIRVKCAFTCASDPIDCAASLKPTIDHSSNQVEPPTGNCYVPVIPHGRTRHTRYMHSGEVLEVQCRPGYTLIGEESTCEIQNTFSPDTRRLPKCVQMELSDEFEGKGSNYNGVRNFPLSGNECENWARLAHTGQFKDVNHGRLLLQQGNHNFCRNLGGNDLVPGCYTSENSALKYCWSTPQCGGNDSNICGSVRSNNINGCEERYRVDRCELENETTRSQAQWFWSNCSAMCCAYAGCQ